jgi:hypothetical protein
MRAPPGKGAGNATDFVAPADRAVPVSGRQERTTFAQGSPLGLAVPTYSADNQRVKGIICPRERPTSSTHLGQAVRPRPRARYTTRTMRLEPGGCQ